jgi:uncharacterized protein (DUF1778 family)
MSKTLTLRLDEASYKLFAAAAKAENRSIANLIHTAALARVREQEFVDPFEMQEIQSDEGLLKRLRQGSKEARHRRGAFVD